MNLLGAAAAWLEAQRHEHLTTPVTYERGADQVVLAATIGRTRFTSTDEYGRVLRHEARDFLVRAVDLVLGGVAVLPRAGDQLLEGGQRYEVMAPAGEPEWGYADVNRQTLRVHTRQIAGETTP